MGKNEMVYSYHQNRSKSFSTLNSMITNNRDSNMKCKTIIQYSQQYKMIMAVAPI